jgi:DNA primase catalytic core
MPRIPESEIERVKRETDLVALIQSRGSTLKQKGVNWTGLCPFHDDKRTPNLIVTPSKGLFRCMASNCGKTGNAIQFVQWFDGVSFRHAFEVLSGGGKAAFTQTNGQTKQSTVPKLPCPVDEGAEDAKLLGQVADYYHSRLESPDGKAVLEYLEARGLANEAMMKKFRIGLADRTLGLRLPHKNRVQGKALRQRLEELGVFRKKSGHEHLNGCLTIPITNENGEVVQLYGRRLGKAPRENRHLYLARPLAGIFNPEALKSREIILTESLLDALSFYAHGMEAVTCTYGTENFSPELFDAIRDRKIESVRLAFDADEAGEKATARAAEKLQKYGIECHQIKFPWGGDANAFALDQGGEALKKSVRDAVWLDPENNLVRAPSSLVANKAAKKPEASVSAAKEENILPTVTKPEPALERCGDYYQAAFGSRLYRIGGVEKNSSLEVLRITLRVSCEGLMHVDSLDLYRDGERRKFIERAADETMLERDLLKRDLGKLLLMLEQAQEDRLNTPQQEEESVTLSPEEEAEAMELLQAPNLLERIATAYNEAGIVGEETNKIAAYLACTSRKLAKPLAIIIQSTSAAGKSTLMEAVLSFFPKEEQVKYSAMTGQSLYYLGETSLKHKILAIVEEEGAEKASYALKLLQSEGELTIASTGKDPHSGRMETQEYHVEGPSSLILTTTSIDIDEELMNRCLVLTVDETREQTERIHQLQREARTIEGILAAEKRKDIIRMMQNAQRLLKPWKIANPYARHLTFTSGRTRTRRDHEKYLTLIDSIALLHQYQRTPIKHTIEGREIEMLPVTLEDIEAANKLAPEVLGRSLDELPPQTRRLLESIKKLVRGKMETESIEQRLTLFSRRELREFTGWSEFQVRTHLERLEQMEYVSRRGGKQGSRCFHELLVDASEAAKVWQVGLIDVEKLRKKKD